MHFSVKLFPILLFLLFLLEELGVSLFDEAFGGLDLLLGVVGDDYFLDSIVHSNILNIISHIHEYLK